MTEQPGTPSSWERWYKVATSFVAPATFVTALLFYFGYVSSRAQYAYFGVDVDTIGLSTRDFVMRSPQALLVPVLLLTVLGAVLLAVTRLLNRHPPSGTGLAWIQRTGWTVVGLGALMVVGYRWLGGWPAYGMVTPLVLTAGLLVLAWVWQHTGARGAAVALAVVAAGVCIFWAMATLAEWTGTGVAKRTARNLDELPAVVLDTKESLVPTDGVVQETRLPKEAGQQYTYRYRGFRLLIQAGDRMFLVPDHWTEAGSTYLVPTDDVRVRFRFVNDPP
jgi:hypothetical protein